MKCGASIEITGISGHSWEYALLRQQVEGKKNQVNVIILTFVVLRIEKLFQNPLKFRLS